MANTAVMANNTDKIATDFFELFSGCDIMSNWWLRLKRNFSLKNEAKLRFYTLNSYIFIGELTNYQ